MKIGVVSDTHGRPLPSQMLKDFRDVDLIIHAGDICDWSHYEQLAALQEIKAVYGNMDGAEIRGRLPARQLFSCGGTTIGVYHGEGAPRQLLDKVRASFAADHPAVVVFGHSHEPFNERIDGTLYFNPGSPNDTVCAPYCSYGLLTVAPDKVSGKIIKVKGCDG